MEAPQPVATPTTTPIVGCVPYPGLATNLLQNPSWEQPESWHCCKQSIWYVYQEVRDIEVGSTYSVSIDYKGVNVGATPPPCTLRISHGIFGPFTVIVSETINSHESQDGTGAGQPWDKLAAEWTATTSDTNIFFELLCDGVDSDLTVEIDNAILINHPKICSTPVNTPTSTPLNTPVTPITTPTTTPDLSSTRTTSQSTPSGTPTTSFSTSTSDSTTSTTPTTRAPGRCRPGSTQTAVIP
ncbi:hypothetical protein B0T10DRAFT_461354 [Thelonectria olida]|uniref:Uncharacterized protein n=1 Tax=Thelonectria olida TaxID=1576542 RepID=A0A9P9AQX0_9HYPO|nr:hypothetical protein B0T10DRAFT_461354 [Thelonectria olida]